MALVALGAVTVVAILAFIKSTKWINKAATGLMWTVAALWSFGGGL